MDSMVSAHCAKSNDGKKMLTIFFLQICISITISKDSKFYKINVIMTKGGMDETNNFNNKFFMF